MIALNELIDNYDNFMAKYSFIGCESDLRAIIALENERKSLQLDYEQKRAETNKLCNVLAVKKSNNNNIDEIYFSILKNEQELNNQEKELTIQNNKINKMLKLLPNLPDEILSENRMISNNSKVSKESNSNDFKNYIKKFATKYFTNDFAKTNKLKPLSNYVFEDKQIILIESENCFDLLLTHKNFDLMQTNILNYLKNSSKKLVQIKTNSMAKSSSTEYKAKLFSNEIVKINLKREYYSRLYNIKYKNNEIDMTKFVCQIDIKF